MEEFLNELGIAKHAEKSNDGSYVIDIESSDEYGRIYSKLDRSDLVDEAEESSQLTIDTSSIQFEGDDYILTLLADFNEDLYKLVVREKED